MSDKAKYVVIDYTNYAGKRADRLIAPHFVRFDKTEWHTEQWLLRAYDLGKQDDRDFAMGDIHSWRAATEEECLTFRPASEEIATPRSDKQGDWDAIEVSLHMMAACKALASGIALTDAGEPKEFPRDILPLIVFHTRQMLRRFNAFKFDRANGTPCAQIRWDQERSELRGALEEMLDLYLSARPDAFANGVKDSNGYIDDGEVRAGEVVARARRVIWKSPGADIIDRPIGGNTTWKRDEVALAAPDLLASLKSIVQCHAEFRNELPDDWDGDPLDDLMPAAKAAIARAEGNR